MKQPLLQSLVIGALMGGSFLLGQLLMPPALEAQGRGPVPTPPPAPPDASPTTPGGESLVYTEAGGGSSGGANGFIAVTGSYGIGTSVLYVLDTENRQLAVYEARGGAASMHRLMLVGARRIDLDLQLEGYNDRSEYEYGQLQRLFDRRDRKDGEPKTGLERPRQGRKE